MQRESKSDKYRYLARQPETAFFSITPTKVAPLVVAADNGTPLCNIGSMDAPKFEVKLVEPPRFVHSIVLNCAFPPGSAQEATYKIVVSDAAGHVWADIPTVRPIDDPDVGFTIIIS